jgi:hypothetical protein
MVCLPVCWSGEEGHFSANNQSRPKKEKRNRKKWSLAYQKHQNRKLGCHGMVLDEEEGKICKMDSGKGMN